jgi:23S rRNA pseudouridine2605 synthase
LGERDIRALVEAAGATLTLPSGPSKHDRQERANSRRRGNSGGPRPSMPRAPEERKGPERLVRTERRRAGDAPKRSSQPDPMETSVGYIGADSLQRERQRRKNGEKAFRAGLVGPKAKRGPSGGSGGGFGGGGNRGRGGR